MLLDQRVFRVGIVLTAAMLATAEAPAQESAEPSGGLTAEELAAEPARDTGDTSNQPVSAAEATNVKVSPVAENGGYFDEQGRYVVDLMEQDYVYIAIQVETTDGQPVEDAEPSFSVIEGTSQLLEPADVSMPSMTDQYGIVEFAVVGGQMGLDRIVVEYGDASTEILVNVISLEARSYTLPDDGEGYLSWSDLMQAQVRYDNVKLYAEFPPAVTERSGETVKMSGFMMPLEAGMKQEWFLLTTHPPGCFFHVPGGPSGAVEVFAEEGIEVSWDPIVVEGRFEALEESDSAVYRLHDARIAGR